MAQLSEMQKQLELMRSSPIYGTSISPPSSPSLPTNLSGLHPQGAAVLVSPADTTLKADKIVIPDAVAGSTAIADQRCRVIEVGPLAWEKEGRPRAKAGDIVLVTKYAGFIAAGKDGRLYRLVNATDIFCTVEE
jgi:co-chaperonin GroES (HSP10)